MSGIPGSMGIILQQVSQVRFYSEDRKLSTYINVTIIEENHSLLRSLLQDFQYLCKDSQRRLQNKIMEFKNLCNPLRNKIIWFINDLDRLNYLFFAIPRTLNKEVYPEGSNYDHIYGYIGKLSNSTTDFIEDSQNSTMYFQNWFNLQNEDRENFKGHLELLKDELVALETGVTALEVSPKYNFILDSILEHFQKTLAFTFILVEKHYVNLVMLQKYYISGVNYIDLEYFVPITQLKSFLIHIKTELEHSGMSLIIDPHSYLARKYYKILQVETFFTRDLIVFSVSIPFIQDEIYNYFKAIPFPIQIKNELFAFIVPQNTHFAYNDKQNLMMPLTADEFENCIEFKRKHYCKETLIKYNTYDQKFCEIEVIKTLRVPSFCNFRLIKSKYDMFFPLYNPNTWSYTLIHSSSVLAQCASQPASTIPINEQGVMSVAEGCSLQINGFNINAQNKYSNKEIHYILPQHYEYGIKTKIFTLDILKIEHIPYFDVPIHQRDSEKMLVAGSLSLHEIIDEKVLLTYRYSMFELFVMTFSFVVSCFCALLISIQILKFFLLEKSIPENSTEVEYANPVSYQSFRQNSILLDRFNDVRQGSLVLPEPV